MDAQKTSGNFIFQIQAIVPYCISVTSSEVNMKQLSDHVTVSDAHPKCEMDTAVPDTTDPPTAPPPPITTPVAIALVAVFTLLIAMFIAVMVVFSRQSKHRASKQTDIQNHQTGTAL